MGNAYGDFSQYYDLLGWNGFARSSAIRLQAFFKLRGEHPRTILDLACGTGELEKSMAGSGIEFTGVDSSPGMIKVARKKYPDAKYIVADAATFRLDKKFDMVLLLFDSANHMRSFPHLYSVIKNARRHLNPGGFFIFDFLTEHGLEEWEQINIRRTKDYTLFWYGHYYPERQLADIFIEAFVRSKTLGKSSAIYKRVFERIVEKSYPAANVIEGLTKAGFQKIMASPYDVTEKIEEASRLWFVCN
jgi:ubiquinone/menaquinone biosynthesis C-methylase UbiE